MITRAHAEIKGIVQGVGFRPFIHQLAREFGMKGWVLNATDGVTLEVEGELGRVEGFLRSLQTETPPLVVIDGLQVTRLSPIGYDDFTIRKSVEKAGEFVLVSPDVATCEECQAEIFDPDDRRFRYPFTNCTHCGPRFTILSDLPYDRAKTTMDKFEMCEACRQEYEDLDNRRYHAQPNACPACGPAVWIEPSGTATECGDCNGGPIAVAACLLKDGKLLAVKGLGGFHLACDAGNDAAVRELRRRKGREEKPFALMTASVESLQRFCEVSSHEQTILRTPAAPIVLLKRRPDSPIAEAVAPGNKYLGVMLPYTPLHHLLLSQPGLPALVMTSGNLSEEPLCRSNEEAKRRLGPLVDYFLLHNRDIEQRCDDSVVRCYPAHDSCLTIPAHPISLQFLRRSRGYAPFPVRIDRPLRPLLAVGAELKNTFCFTRDNYLFLSHHVGDLQNVETLDYYHESIEHYRKLFRLEPEAIAYDPHPDYLSTKYALEQTDLPKIAVQHHHAHIASCMAEHGVEQPVIGVALDGMGYGTDGRLWGGEFLLVTRDHFERKAHFQYIPMPGGDRATREPWRMAVAYLYHTFGEAWIDLDLPFVNDQRVRSWPVLKRMIDQSVNAPETSSCGRLFDAVAALAGLRESVSFEGQAAMELEMCADESVEDSYEIARCTKGESGDSARQLDFRETLRGIVRDLRSCLPVSMIAARFHRALAATILDQCARLRSESRIATVALSGGVFQNRFLHRLVVQGLDDAGFQVLYHRRLPCNDGGLSVGQAYVADARLKSGNSR